MFTFTCELCGKTLQGKDTADRNLNHRRYACPVARFKSPERRLAEMERGKKRAECLKAKELSRMFDVAVSTLIRRTASAFRKVDRDVFKGDHPALEWCVKSLFDLNYRFRGLSIFCLSPGMCAGLTYLMACSKSNQATYGKHKHTERGLDFSLLDKAEEFICRVANMADTRQTKKSFPVLLDLLSSRETTNRERLTGLINEWNRFIKRPDLMRTMDPTVGGIDLGFNVCKEDQE